MKQRRHEQPPFDVNAQLEAVSGKKRLSSGTVKYKMSHDGIILICRSDVSLGVVTKFLETVVGAVWGGGGNFDSDYN